MIVQDSLYNEKHYWHSDVFSGNGIIELKGHLYEIDVAVYEQLQENALLGMDLPLMKHLIYVMNSKEKQTAREQLGPSETFYAVTTKAQEQQQKTQKEKQSTNR